MFSLIKIRLYILEFIFVKIVDKSDQLLHHVTELEFEKSVNQLTAQIRVQRLSKIFVHISNWIPILRPENKNVINKH